MADAPRSRSRSPPRKAPKGSGGFRWKDNRRRDEGNDRKDREDRRRDHRDRSRSPRGPRHFDRDGDRDRYRNREEDRRRDRDRDQGRGRDDDREGDKDRPQSPRRRELEKENRQEGDKPDAAKKPKKEKKDKKPAPAMKPGQEMIIVTVNDRLGTKAQIPCLASDTIGQLKIMVAARIGRRVGQIVLKRQSERSMKDMITLEDYGVSHGTQLDLEYKPGE